MATKGAIIARIISEYSDKGSKVAAKDIDKLGKQFHDFGSKVGKTFAIAAAASAAFAIKLGVDSVRAAMAEQESIAILTKTLQNVTGATNDQINAVDAYIKQTMLRLNVQDDLLRPSLQALLIATHDITKAESLQQVALDVSANRGKDLTAVSIALAKAYAGNFNALKRLGVPLSETLIKSKDFVGIVKELESATKGSAAAAADTFAGKVSRIGLAFEEVKKSIGNAIILALQPFLDKFTKYLPQIEKWLNDNGDKIAGFFIAGISYGIAFAQILYDTFSFVARNIKTFEVLGAVIAAAFFGAKVAGAVQGVIIAITAIIKVTKALRTVTLSAALAESLLTGGISAAAGAAAFAAALVATGLVVNKFNAASDKAADKVGALKFNFKGLGLTVADYTKGLAGTTSATSKMTAEQVKAAKIAAQLVEVNKALANKGLVATTETNPIELEAVRLNLLKQHNIELDAAYARLVANYEAQMSGNVAAQKYADILGVIADKDISNAELNLLAKKWGQSQEAVIAYIGSILNADAFSKDLIDPGAIAAKGWQKALGDLNSYIVTLKTIPSMNAGAPAGQSGAPSSQGYGSTQAVSDTLRSIDQAVQDALDAAAAADAAVAAAQGVIAGLNPNLLAIGQQSADITDSDNRLRRLSGYSSATTSFGTSAASFSGASASNASAGGITVIVNNAGSVISNSDLVTSITQGLQQGQLSGKAVTFNGQAF
jgi:hypothetical protein